MQFLELSVRPAILMHGYDDENQPIEESIESADFAPKLIAVQRIQSITEEYLLVAGSHDRVMYWEYEGSMAEVVARLADAGLVISRSRI